MEALTDTTEQTTETNQENQLAEPIQTAEQIAEQIAETLEKDSRVNFKTDPLFKYSPGFNHAKGSFLKINKDGSVSYRNPACIEYRAPGSKPFKMPALKGRNDGSRKTFERIRESIDKRNVPGRNGVKPYANVSGRPVGLGYRMVATDGHVALVEYAEGTGDSMPILERFHDTARHVATIGNPEFHLALKRAKIMAPDTNSLVRIIGTPGQLLIESSHEEPKGQIHGNDSGDFAETLEIECTHDFYGAFNLTYLEPVCGTWPLNVWWKDVENQIVFEPVDGSWRYVVMPIRYEWKKSN